MRQEAEKKSVEGAGLAPPEDQLRSWTEIAAYLGTTPRTVQRWERDIGLPIQRIVHKRKSTVYASKSEIESWRRSRSGEPDTEDEPAGPVVEPSADEPPARWSPPKWVGWAAGVVLAVGLIALSFREQPRRFAPRTRTLTSLAGTEINPALSPDGKQVAFAWRGPDRADFDLYVMNLDGTGRRALAETPQSEISPAWSPDGTRIAFLRTSFDVEREMEGRDLVILSVEDGEETPVQGRAQAIPSAIDWLPEPWLAWTRDGKYIISSGGGVNREPGLFRVGIAEREFVRLTSTSVRAVGDLAPAVSPDGGMIAFIRRETPVRGDLYVLDEGAGNPRRLTYWERYTSSPAFTPDGSRILVSSGDFGGERRLWSVDPSGETEPELLLLAGEDSFGLALGLGEDGPRLVFARGTLQTDVWRLGPEGNERLISSSRMDSNAAYSPDGEQIVFESNRSGRAELWLADADGRAQRQMTTDMPPLAGAVTWAPDGNQVAAAAAIEEGLQLFLVSVDDGSVRQLTRGELMHFSPRWAPDGKRIYADVGRGEFWSLSLVDPRDGTFERLFGAASQIADESSEGSVYTAGADGWIYAVDGNRPDAKRIGRFWRPDAFQPTQGGVAFLGPGMYDHPAVLYRWSRSTEEAGALANVERPWMGLSVSPDGERMLYSRVEGAELDLQMADEVW